MFFTELTAAEKNTLLDVAKNSIAYGLQHNKALPVEISEFSETLQTQGATFVTLNIQHQLRGCIGTLEAYQALIKDVSDHAYAAAFQDPRFSPLTEKEFPLLEIHISILTPPEPMKFSSEEDLLQQIKPGIDGLILQMGFNKGTFLPAVWESLPNKKDFLNHLKQKAGLPMNFWSDEIKVSRYETIYIP